MLFSLVLILPAVYVDAAILKAWVTVVLLWTVLLVAVTLVGMGIKKIKAMI